MIFKATAGSPGRKAGRSNLKRLNKCPIAKVVTGGNPVGLADAARFKGGYDFSVYLCPNHKKARDEERRRLAEVLRHVTTAKSRDG